jgi:hypothetical protein
MAHRAASDILIASTKLQLLQSKFEDGITREVKDLAST